MLMSVLRYLLDKESNFDLVFLDFFSDSQVYPNKSSKHELNNFIYSCCIDEQIDDVTSSMFNSFYFRLQ